LNENEASVLFDKRWDILHWEVESPHTRCPYEEPSTVTRNLEVIAERLTVTKKLLNYSEKTYQTESRNLLKDIFDEDWFRYSRRNGHQAMRFNVLSNDLTMTGTLFKLWESIRLDTNETNVTMMLMYLKTLMRPDYPFEEWFYYQDLLKKITGHNLKSSPWVRYGLAFNILKALPVKLHRWK
jgi:hypothetical protein